MARAALVLALAALAAALAPTARAAPALCAHHQLRAALGRGNGAAGHFYWSIVFICRLPRFGDTVRPVVRGRTGQ